MQEVRADMAANVWKHVVREGDRVEDGDVLVVLESMKMEIPLYSEWRGVVNSLAVPEGAVVQEGDLIVLVDDAAA